MDKLPPLIDFTQPGAISHARERLMTSTLPPDSTVRRLILALLDRMESDPVFCRAWCEKRKRERELYNHFGPEVVDV